MVDRYKIRVVPADENTLIVMRECHESAKWTAKNEHIRDHMLAYAIAQLPRNYWYLKIKNLQDDNAIRNVNKYCKHVNRFVAVDKLGLLIHGPTGVGKTFMAVHIGKHVVSKNLSTWFWDNKRFTNECLQAMKDSAIETRINAIIDRTKLLIIDNVTQGWEKGIRRIMFSRLEDILRRRQNIGPTIFTLRGETDLLDNPVGSLAQEMMAPIKMTGVDMRTNVGRNKLDSVQ